MSGKVTPTAKKKYTQNDLRRLMQEQKIKSMTKSSNTSANVERIESPLAKYNEKGQLTCALCKTVVRSEAVWKVHINSKAHKENIAAAKELKDRLKNTTASISQKRTISKEEFLKPEVPAKKLKGILQNSLETVKSEGENNNVASVPNDFFDSKQSFFTATLSKTSIRTDLVNIKRDCGEDKMDVETVDSDEKLPEGFFDDPVKDAKIRNLEYKDPQEEEWEKFQREIKEQANVSMEIIAGEQDEATAERQIEEIDEQIRKWSKVLDLEKKKELVIAKKNEERPNKMDQDDRSSESEEDDINFDEFLDWRAKRLK